MTAAYEKEKTMNLEELKARLAEQDAKLDQLVRLNTTQVHELQLSKTRSSLRWLVPGLVIELLLAIVGVVWAGDFIVGHLREPRFLLPALLVDISLIAFLGSCIRQLVTIAGLDYSLPVVTVQKTLGGLRILRIRTSKWVMMLSFLLWAPLLIVVFESLFGIDLWQVLAAAGPRDEFFLAWVVANVLFGLGIVLVALWLSHRYANRMDRSPIIKRLMDDFAGRSLTKAQASLDAIVRFETEPQEAHESGSK
jgi:hypothetical protein